MLCPWFPHICQIVQDIVRTCACWLIHMHTQKIKAIIFTEKNEIKYEETDYYTVVKKRNFPPRNRSRIFPIWSQSKMIWNFNTMVQEKFVSHLQEKIILPVSGRKVSFFEHYTSYNCNQAVFMQCYLQEFPLSLFSFLFLFFSFDLFFLFFFAELWWYGRHLMNR